MSIINEALKKAREERDKRTIQDLQGAQNTETGISDIIVKEKVPDIKYTSIFKAQPERKNIFLNPILLSVLAIALIVTTGFVVSSYKKNSPASSTVVPVETKAPVTVTAPSGKQISLYTPPKISQWAPNFELSGVVHGDGAPMAVINGSVFMIGDRVGQASLIEIGEDFVLLEKGGEKVKLVVK